MTDKPEKNTRFILLMLTYSIETARVHTFKLIFIGNLI